MENTQIDLKTKSVTELKALAYDLGIMVNEYRNMLNIVNQEIIDRSRATLPNGMVETAAGSEKESKPVEETNQEG